MFQTRNLYNFLLTTVKKKIFNSINQMRLKKGGGGAICIPESFHSNISYELFHSIITFVNSQLENTNSKGDFVLKNGLKRSF